MLAEIGADHTLQILVMNKADLLPEGTVDVNELAQRIAGGIEPSGQAAGNSGVRPDRRGRRGTAGLDGQDLALDPVTQATFRLPAGEGGLLNLLHERAKILSTQYVDDVCEVEAEVPESVRRELTQFLVTPALQ